MSTGIVDNIDAFSIDMDIKGITLYNPMLNHYYANYSMQIIHNKDEVNYKIHTRPEVKAIDIGANNIEKIEFSSRCTYSNKNNYQLINIHSENYAKIQLDSAINYKDILGYINEFDIMVSAYSNIPTHSYETYIHTSDGKTFNAVHRLLGKEKYKKEFMHRYVKMDFYSFIEKMYKTINYRDSKNKNEFILLDLKRPTVLEDQYIFYFRFIDLYMGKYLSKNGKQLSNYDRLSNFVDNNIQYFDNNDYTEVENLKNELNSLRNHFVHEGYYFPKGYFEVTGKNRKVLYNKTIDYMWLYRIVKVFRYCSYLIMYKNILSIEIDESELKMALNS